ncbi:plasmid pRiA4b ORF-3 family protein [Okeania sp. SIO2B3]|uniref:plasmid pRiA4b ORF-3 family protein n=1 Tax=Okeania sp. SIO2B3 TaxID=2607784 RepID=UPI0013BF7D58|nr:plasmid pRiA4b ORF-3 family protein [Okeania sp. SIO2B3]NET47129.1 plasmid pRiA4b ORF-3 family protein [Okeania sp. SIO2B3]
MSNYSEPVIYQLKVVLLGISPMIWRRLLVKSDSTIEDLHYILQIAMGWEDIHLHYFTIHGQQYGVSQLGGIDFHTNASLIKLSQFRFQKKEKFLYEYDLSTSPALGVWRHWWQHQIRVEAILPHEQNQTLPICISGKGICPPENCGGAWGFMKARDEFSVHKFLELLSSLLEDKNIEIDREEIAQLQTWLKVYQNKFDRQLVNKRLKQYSQGDKESILFKQEIL